MNLKGIMQTLGAKPGQVVSNPYVKAFAATPTIIEAEGVNEAVDFRDGKYRFYSKDGIGYLTYNGKKIADGDYDYEGGNAYFMNHSSFKRGQTAFDTGKDVIAYFKKNNITNESVNEASEPLKLKGIKINKTNDITFILEISFLMGEKVVISYLSTGTQMDAQKLKSKIEKAFSAGKVLSPSAIGYYAYNEGVVNEASYTVKADNAYQFINGATAVLGVYLRDEKLESGVKNTLQRVVKDLEGLRKYFFSRKDESVNTESVNKSLRLPKLK